MTINPYDTYTVQRDASIICTMLMFALACRGVRLKVSHYGMCAIYSEVLQVHPVK